MKLKSITAAVFGAMLLAAAPVWALSGSGGGGGVTGWPLSYFEMDIPNSASSALSTANKLNLAGFVLPYSLTFSKIRVYVGTTDATNSYDFGIYTQAGALVADTGAIHLPSNLIQSFNTVQGAVTLNPGLYAFAWTGNATTATIVFSSTNLAWVAGSGVDSSTGGALPSSITALTVSPALNEWWFSLGP